MADEQLNQANINKRNIVKEHKKRVETPIKKEKNEDQGGHNQETKTEIKEETKKEKQEKKINHKIKKTEAVVNARNLRISLKDSVAIGNFIKNKKIDNAILDLELVIKKKKPLPFKGELPHKKGSMGSGRFPIKASKEFVRLLKSLNANSSFNGMDLDRSIISEVVPNKAPKQYHRFGSTTFKRTHVIIKAKEIGEKNKI